MFLVSGTLLIFNLVNITFKNRQVREIENYQRVLDLAGHGKIPEALAEARTYAQDGKGHPIFLDTMKDLEG